MIFDKIGATGINLFAKRFFRRRINLKAWPNDWVPFHWKRPEKVPGYYDSSDLVPFQDPPKDSLRPEVRNSKELSKMEPEDPLRKIFSSSHSKRIDYSRSYTQDHLKQLGLIHIVDYSNSLEAKIIKLTFALRKTIKEIQEAGDTNRYKGHVRTRANTIKNKRYRHLCDLKELHVDRFKRITETLNIEHMNNPINVPFIRPYRKKQMKLLAIEYARDLKEKKVEDFIKSIEQEKIQFKDEKNETLKWIQEQENKLGITV